MICPKCKCVFETDADTCLRMCVKGELQDALRRQLAIDGLLKLWEAMELSHPFRIGVRASDTYETHRFYYRLYRFVGETLVGEECPGRETWT